MIIPSDLQERSGDIFFQEESAVSCDIATQDLAEVIIERRNGVNGAVDVDYITLDLDESEFTATAGDDYEFSRGTIHFKEGEMEKRINIPLNVDHILSRPTFKNVSLSLQLSNV